MLGTDPAEATRNDFGEPDVVNCPTCPNWLSCGDGTRLAPPGAHPALGRGDLRPQPPVLRRLGLHIIVMAQVMNAFFGQVRQALRAGLTSIPRTPPPGGPPQQLLAPPAGGPPH